MFGGVNYKSVLKLHVHRLATNGGDDKNTQTMCTQSRVGPEPIKGTLGDRRVDLERFYDIFTIYKDNSRVLAEGNSLF